MDGHTNVQGSHREPQGATVGHAETCHPFVASGWLAPPSVSAHDPALAWNWLLCPVPVQEPVPVPVPVHQQVNQYLQCGVLAELGKICRADLCTPLKVVEKNANVMSLRAGDYQDTDKKSPSHADKSASSSITDTSGWLGNNGPLTARRLDGEEGTRCQV